MLSRAVFSSLAELVIECPIKKHFVALEIMRDPAHSVLKSEAYLCDQCVISVRYKGLRISLECEIIFGIDCTV